jgi:putative transposase
VPTAGSSTGPASTPGARANAAVCPEADYTELVTAAHRAPVILCWDNLNTHVSGVMRAFTGAHQDWLTVVQLPAAYAPDLNPVEGAWPNMKNSLGNLGSCSTPDQLAATVKNRLKRIQYRPELITGFLAQTGLSLEPEPP